MLQLAKSLSNIPIVSLRTGGVIATASRPIINPNNLKIEGWYCQDKFSKESLVLLGQDVRDIIAQGLVVNDHEVLSDPEEIIRLHDIFRINFELLGKSVITENKRRIGKVNDFATEITSLYIKKLYVSQPVYKSLSGGQLSVDRTQVVEVTNKRIIIRDIEGLMPARAAASANIGV